MSFFQKIQEYGDRHHTRWMDGIRMILGAMLIIKGYQFMWNMPALQQIIEQSPFPYFAYWLAYFITFAHLAGGFLIGIGMLTRIAVLFQIPILLGAVFFVNLPKGFNPANPELEFSILVLCLLFFFLVYGSGDFSADRLLKRYKKGREYDFYRRHKEI